MEKKTKIEVKGVDIKRPDDRPAKTNWKIELIKKGLSVLQHAAPKKSAEIIWHFFTMPGRTKFSEPQKELLLRSSTSESNYRGDKIVSYTWGTSGPRVLLCHGWRSKTADFRRMIEAFLQAGYVVEGLDLRAHGNSEGKHTALPEYKEILKNHLVKNGPYEVILGYSMGAAAIGLVLNEVSPVLHPKQFFVIAGPPFVRYFFKDLVEEVGCNESVYEAMCAMVEEYYYQTVDYFDLRDKGDYLKEINTHLVYCEDDQIIPFEKGLDLEKSWPHARFVHVKGLGHYKIIVNEAIINYIINSIKS